MQADFTILIIEDDLIIAENLRENLEELGYQSIFISKNYKQVQAVYNKIKPDLFIVDIRLDGSEKDGIDIMVDLFKDHHRPLIYLTSSTEAEYRDRAKATTPSAYLVKPVSKGQLDVALDFAISTQGQIINQPTVHVDSCPFISTPDFFYVKTKERYERIDKSEIVALKSQGTYTEIITPTKVVTHYVNIKALIDRINKNNLVRCHNSYAVNINFVNSFDHENLYLLGGKDVRSVPLGSTYRSEVMGRLPRL